MTYPTAEQLIEWAHDSGYTEGPDGWYDEDGQGPYVLLDQWTAAMESAAEIDYITGTGPLEGATQIHIERSRQKMVEGWTPEHDDEHTDGSLVHAARSYLTIYNFPTALSASADTADGVGWPWAHEWWKPSDDPIKNLVRAGALIAAEIDRLQRAEAPTG